MYNDFDKWNEIKKKTHATGETDYFPKEKEVWMCLLGKNVGFEQNGGGENFSRPVLIIKRFNNQMFWCVPLSTRQKKLDFYFNFDDPEGRSVAVILAQLRLISLKRLKRKMYVLDDLSFRHICRRMRLFLS